MSFKASFEKTALIGALAQKAASLVGKGLGSLSRGAARVSSGNFSKPLSFGDKASAAITALGASSDYGDTAAKMRAAQLR